MTDNVHLGLGAFASQKRLDQYLEYTRGEDDDESPINEFSADQAEDYYDHDWMEAIYKQGGSIKTLLESPSYQTHGCSPAKLSWSLDTTYVKLIASRTNTAQSIH